MMLNTVEPIPVCEKRELSGEDNYLVIENLTKRFGKMEAVKNVSFSVKKGELVTLLGPSGCGKSTILRCVAGLEHFDEGKISLAGQTFSSAEENTWVPPEKRDVGMVFQSYAVWPHMTVWGNVAYPLQVHNVKKDEVEHRVDEILTFVGLKELAHRNVTMLSGGQQQRVVLARALVHNPRILLFDEPLSNLDTRLRSSMRHEIRRIQQKIGIAALYVTHDQAEAMALADRVIVMNQGNIEQMGPGLEIYRKPVTAFTAAFFGEVNFIDGVLDSPDPKFSPFMPVNVEVDGKKYILYARTQEKMKPGDKVRVCIRPQDLEIDKCESINNEIPSIEGELTDIIRMGNMVEYYLKVGPQELCHHNMQDLGFETCDRIRIYLKPDRCVCVPR